MSEDRARRLLVGGRGPLRFGVPLERVVRVEDWGALASPRRVVDLPRVFDLPAAPAEEDRYAQVETDLAEGAVGYLRLGATVRAESRSPSSIGPMPRVLEIVAARWGWREIVLDEDGVVVVVDPDTLVPLGALREGEAP